MMKALGVRSFGKVEKIELLELPVPVIRNPDDIIVQVKAVGLNPADEIRLSGYSRLIETITLPVVIGCDYAGIVSAVGSSVTHVSPGDRVYGMNLGAATAAEYVLLSSNAKYCIAKMPPSCSFAESASLPAVGLTVMQSLARADALVPGGLQGKTVLVLGGLGGTGSLALQLLRTVYNAGKIITTVSTNKVTLVPQLLGDEAVDQTVDYMTQNVIKEVGNGTVDFMLDTVRNSMSYLPLLKQGTGIIFTIVGKTGEMMAKDWPETPWLLLRLLDILDAIYSWRASRWGVVYQVMFTNVQSNTDLDKLAGWVEEGKLKPILGKITKMNDLEAVRQICSAVFAGKGGVGKYVIELD